MAAAVEANPACKLSWHCELLSIVLQATAAQAGTLCLGMGPQVVLQVQLLALAQAQQRVPAAWCTRQQRQQQRWLLQQAWAGQAWSSLQATLPSQASTVL
jgi:hypothetical protein